MKTLRGVKVVSLALNLPGPMVAHELKNLGATIVKIEPLQGDQVIRFSRPIYKHLNRGQKILKLDLKSTGALEKLFSLLRDADILLTSSRPSSLKKLGLTKVNLKKINPRLSHVAITGYPGKLENRPGHDLTYQAAKGFVEPPQMPFTFWSDLAGAQQALLTIFKCLYLREKSKTGTYASVSLSQSLDFFALPVKYGATDPSGFLGGRSPRYRLYKAKSGWVAVAAIEEHFWQKLILKIGASYGENLEKYFLKKTDRVWEKWAIANDLPVVRVYNINEFKQRSTR
jgi:alpha-methylacyl-CoA racemase